MDKCLEEVKSTGIFVCFSVSIELDCLDLIYINIQWVDKKKWPPHYNTVVVYKMQKVPKQCKNTHGAVQINSE